MKTKSITLLNSATLKTKGIKLTSAEEEEEEATESKDELSKDLSRRIQFYYREVERRRRSRIISRAKSKIAIQGYFPSGTPTFGYTTVNMKIKNSGVGARETSRR